MRISLASGPRLRFRSKGSNSSGCVSQMTLAQPGSQGYRPAPSGKNS